MRYRQVLKRIREGQNKSVDRLMSKPSIVCFGQASIDAIENERGIEKNLLGGSAVYVATVAANLGLKTAIVTRVGIDFDRRFLSYASGAGIDTRGVKVDSGLTSRIYLRYRSSRLTKLQICEGVNASLSEKDFPVEFLSSRVVYMGPAPHSALVALSTLLCKRGVRVCFDPHADYDRVSFGKIQEILRNVEIFFSNHVELRNITGATSIDSGAARVLKAGPRLAVITMGQQGAKVYSESLMEKVPSEKANKIVDYVGAGDSFAAGFLSSYIRGGSIRESGKQGSLMAVKAISDFGLRAFLK